MSKIITTTQLQKHIGQCTADVQETSLIVTNNGEGRIVMLPYFDGCDDSVIEYMEDFEMSKNQSSLREKYAKSSRSGASDLTV